MKDVKDFSGQFKGNAKGAPKPDVNTRAKPNKNHPAVPQFTGPSFKPEKK
jgi:hypothetical protein